MNRSELQKISRIRLRESRLLLYNKKYEGSYYLGGYAVECAIKACIAKKIKQYDFPDKKLANDSYIHDLEKLISVAGLKSDLETESLANPTFAVNWSVVKDWSEKVRYNTTIPMNLAKDFYSALSSRQNGVMKWLRSKW